MGTARRNRRWTVAARQWETNPRAHRLTRGWKNATEPAVNPPPSSAFAGVKLREQWRGETSHRRSFCRRYPGNFFYGSRRFFVLYLGRTFLELCERWFLIRKENTRIIIVNIAREVAGNLRQISRLCRKFFFLCRKYIWYEITDFNHQFRKFRFTINKAGRGNLLSWFNRDLMPLQSSRFDIKKKRDVKIVLQASLLPSFSLQVSFINV